MKIKKTNHKIKLSLFRSGTLKNYWILLKNNRQLHKFHWLVPISFIKSKSLPKLINLFLLNLFIMMILETKFSSIPTRNYNWTSNYIYITVYIDSKNFLYKTFVSLFENLLTFFLTKNLKICHLFKKCSNSIKAKP